MSADRDRAVRRKRQKRVKDAKRDARQAANQAAGQAPNSGTAKTADAKPSGGTAAG